MKILVLGATGLVGKDVVENLKNNNNVKNIICPTRAPIAAHPKISNIDFNSWFEDIQNASNKTTNTLTNIDAVICCLGTTIKLAKSKENFIKIDHEIVLKIANQCKLAGIKSFSYNSSIGADIHSKQLYIHTKALVEKDLTTLNFENLTIVRPSLLSGGPRKPFRFGEWLGIGLTKIFNPLLPKKYRSIKTSKVANALCFHSTQINKKALTIIESDQLQNF